MRRWQVADLFTEITELCAEEHGTSSSDGTVSVEGLLLESSTKFLCFLFFISTGSRHFRIFFTVVALCSGDLYKKYV